MLDSWQSLLNKPVDTSGYDIAIKHYRILKDKMINQITERAKLELAQDGYASFVDNIENLILQNASGWDDSYEAAQSTLNNDALVALSGQKVSFSGLTVVSVALATVTVFTSL